MVDIYKLHSFLFPFPMLVYLVLLAPIDSLVTSLDFNKSVPYFWVGTSSLNPWTLETAPSGLLHWNSSTSTCIFTTGRTLDPTRSTLIPIWAKHNSCALFMHSLIVLTSIISFYILTSSKESFTYLYQASPTDVLLPWSAPIYMLINLLLLQSSSLLEALLLALDRTVPLSPFLDETLSSSLGSWQVSTVAHTTLSVSKRLIAGVQTLGHSQLSIVGLARFPHVAYICWISVLDQQNP